MLGRARLIVRPCPSPHEWKMWKRCEPMSRCIVPTILLIVSLDAGAHPGGVDECGCHSNSRTSNHHCHPQRAKASCDARVTFTAERPPKAGDEGVLFGPLVSIVDGDSFKVKVQGAVMDVRLQGIDAPEMDQPFGKDARAILEKLIGDEQIVLVFDDVDHYGRIVARAWVADVDINLEMIRRGAAWFDSEYARDDELYNAELKARAAKRGLWSLATQSTIEPWVWRRRGRE